jgi:hypothetical protein
MAATAAAYVIALAARVVRELGGMARAERHRPDAPRRAPTLPIHPSDQPSV